MNDADDSSLRLRSQAARTLIVVALTTAVVRPAALNLPASKKLRLTDHRQAQFAREGQPA
jgi:hypothetical protein